MRALAILGALAVLAPPAAAAPIIGGTAATQGEFPAVVVVKIGDVLCTGEIVDPAWVMTAAHCLDPAELQLASQAAVTAMTTVLVGTIDVATDPGTSIAAADTLLDPDWTHAHFGKHDLALIHLATPAAGVTPLVANFKASLAPVGVAVTMVGYGTTTASASGASGVEFQLPDQVSETCGDIDVGSGASNSDGDLLCFSQAGHVGTCFGDSGGPLLATIAGVQTIVGITSFGDDSCTAYGAYTRTNAEIDFIQAEIPALCANDACVDPAQTSGGCAAGGGAGGGLLGGLAVALVSVGARRRAARRACRARAGRSSSSPAGG